MMLTRNHILSSTLVLYLHLMQLCFALLIRPWFCAMYATFDLEGRTGHASLSCPALPCSALHCLGAWAALRGHSTRNATNAHCRSTPVHSPVGKDSLNVRVYM